MIKLPEKNTQAHQLLELIAISGEFPAAALCRLDGGDSYKEKLITVLKNEKLIRTHYKDKLRGYRLTTAAKKALLAENYDRFSFFLEGKTETNFIKSEITRRLRLHRIAEVFLTMRNAGVQIYRDEKPDVFYPAGEGAEPTQAPTVIIPAFYNSREFKELGGETSKIKNARTIGILLTKNDAYILYNTDHGMMKWDYKSEMRTKALLKYYLCQERLPHQYIAENVKGMIFGSNMEMAYQLLTSTGGYKQNYFVLDGNYDSFVFLASDKYGELLLKLLCDNEKRNKLEEILSKNLHPPDHKLLIENDGIDEAGNPVLFAYSFDMPRISRFNSALNLQNREGTLISFDFQKEVLRKYCSALVDIQTIDFDKFERRFFP